MDFIKILSNAVLWLISQARAIVEWMNKKPKPSDGQNNSPPPESPSKGSSDAQNLYIGHIDKLTGLINGTDPINLQGEVVFYGYNKDNTFIVERLCRVALYGTLEFYQEDNRFGLISLVGPLDSVNVESDPDGQAGKAIDLRLQLHYRKLSELESSYTRDDVVFPTTEILTATLSWQVIEAKSNQEVQLEIELPSGKLTKGEEKGSLVQELTIKPTSILFCSSNNRLSLPTGYSGLFNCGDMFPCDNGTRSVMAHLLPLKFINVSANNDFQTAWKKGVDGVCEVWWKKAGLLIVDPVTDQNPSLDDKYNEIDFDAACGTGAEQYTLPVHYNTSIAPASIITPPHYIEVYLVDQVINTSGGCTLDPGQASAYCILAVPDLCNNPYLLAHEIGHVLGLDHPDGCDPCGSEGSVMDCNYIGPINTAQNCAILNDYIDNTPFTDPVTVHCLRPLNPIIRTMGLMDCCQPDPEP